MSLSPLKLAFAGLGIISLTACGRAPAPDSGEVEDAIARTALAQGGVCIGEDFAWMTSGRIEGTASVQSYDPETDTARLKVFTHMASSKDWWQENKGDSNYSDGVVIHNFPVKNPQVCEYQGYAPALAQQ